ncbi:MAG: hypothetical protein NTY90_04815 [Candidatus Micrarchaeota archaeon]|nr:hypothetical protein [Candidatus Micrarchaeota archaeon]
MKTSFIVRDELYEMLVEEAKKQYGTARKLSEALNAILARHFVKKKSLFGTTRRFSLQGVREEHDRFD